MKEFSLLLSTAIACLLLTTIDSAAGCTCEFEKPSVAYCRADWVAHVRVNNRFDNQKMPAAIVSSADIPAFENARFEMKYNRLFKISKNMRLTKDNQVLIAYEVILPVNAYTPTSSAACGIILEPGHEYLLSGRYVNGTMLIFLCGQILLDDPKESKKHDILEWGEVPEKTKAELGAQTYDKLCAEYDKEEAASEQQSQANNQKESTSQQHGNAPTASSTSVGTPPKQQ